MIKLYPLVSQIVAKLEGKSIVSLLQKCLTFNMNKLEVKHTGLAYSCLLNSKGRIESDLFIHKIDSEYFIETHFECFNKICATLNRYKMREDFNIEKLENFRVYQIENTSDERYNNYEIDPRLDSFGKRFIDDKINFEGENMEIMTESDYIDLRYKFGICEGVEMFESDAIPHNFNMDLLNALSFDKGCYLGQEMVTRTQFLGVVRRRIVSFEYLIKKERSINDGMNRIFSKHSNGNFIESGKVICENGKRGCVLFKLEYLTSDEHYIGNESDKLNNTVNIYRPQFFTKNH